MTDEPHHASGEYRQMNCYLRRLAAATVKTGTYAHLRGPNTKGSTDVPSANFKSRINVLARPTTMLATGQRNLECGRLETIVVVRGNLIDPGNFLNGIDASSPGNIRIVIGNRINHDHIYSVLRAGLRTYKEMLTAQLRSGNYPDFCTISFNIVNDAIGACKREYGFIPRE